MAQAHFYIREAPGGATQHRLELGLVKIIIAGDAVHAARRGAAANEQRFTFGVDKVHAGQARARGRAHLFGQPHRMEHAHHLAVEMDGARQCVDLGITLEHYHRQAGLPEQVGQRGANRAVTDDGDVAAIALCGHALSHACAQPCVPSSRPPTARAA